MASHSHSGPSGSQLHSAVRLGSVKKVREILDQPDVDVNCLNSKHETPLHLACTLGHTVIVQLLITFGANVFIKDVNNENVFERGGPWSIDVINKVSYDHCFWLQGPTLVELNTPLHDAAKLGHLEKLEIILNQQSVDINCINSSHETPLHLACAFGHKSCVHILVSMSADMYSRDCYNNAPIHRAASMEYVNIIEMLITEFKCDPMIKGYQGRSLLHFASSTRNIGLIETLIQRYRLDPITDLDACGSTPLHIAAICGQQEVVNLLIIKYNCPVDIRNEGNETPLHLACYKGHLNVVKTLVEHGADLSVRNWQKTPLVQIATIGGHKNVIKALTNQFGCNLNDTGFQGVNVLHVACKFGHVELAKILITEFGLDPMCVDDDEHTPLHYAALDGHLSIVRMLVLQHNTNLNARDNENDSPLHLAARHGHTNVVRAFINDFNCNRCDKGFEGRTILHIACEYGHIELAEALIIDFGLDPMCMDDDKNTPLHCAAWGGHLSIVKLLASQHNADLNACNNQNSSPLQLAAWKGHTDAVKAMINELNRRTDFEGLQSQAALTSVSHACKQGYEDLAITLIADLVCLSPLSTDSDGNTLLHIAAMYQQEQCVYMLLYTYNAPVYLRNSAGKTAREITKSSNIRTLIDDYLTQNLGNIQANYKELQLLSSKKYSGEQKLTRVFVVGNVMSGKSTLIESLKREGFFNSFGQVTESIVPIHTSGIVPSVHNSKTIGRVLFYDFAGDQEYYSSHSAIIANVLQSKVGTNVFLIVIDFRKDINKVQEEIGYWLCFVSYHNKHASCQSAYTVVPIGSHVDLITNTDLHIKLKGISKFIQTHFSADNFQIYGDTLTLNCRQPRSAQYVRDAILQVSKDAPSYNISLKAAILLGLLEKDFKNVVTCNIQRLLTHIKETQICLPTRVEDLYPVLEQLYDIGLLMIIGRHYEKLEDHTLLLNISKLTNEVHKLLFSNPIIDDNPNLHAQLSMGVLSQSYLSSILPEYISTDCLIQLQYCQSFDHYEVKFDHVAPEDHDSNDSTLFYFPALCKSERKESIVSPDGFNYYIGHFVECDVKLEYFPPRFLHLLFLRLAYSYALQAAQKNRTTSDLEPVALLQKYNRRCTMWKNGIHWLMQEGLECYVESVNNSSGIVIITKSKEEQKLACSEMLFKILREFQQVKEEVCETVALQQYIMDSDNPVSHSDGDKLFDMSQVEQVLRDRKPSIVSVSGRGHLSKAKVFHFVKCTLWGKYCQCLH